MRPTASTEREAVPQRCQACGARKSDGVKLVVDHIKPVRHYWHLRFAGDNLQVLCEPCNLGKGSWDQTDWRCSPDIRPQRPNPWIEHEFKS